MAMMVTGRVLLVCALYVLWCVNGFGDARDNRCIEDDGNVLTHTHNGGNNGLRLKADSVLISTRMGLINAIAAEDGSEDGINNAPLNGKEKTPPGSVSAGSEGNEAPGAGGVRGAAVTATPPSMPGPGVPGTGDEKGQLHTAGQKANEKNNVDPDRKEPKESQDRTNDQLPSPSGSSSTRSGEKSSLTGTNDLTPLPKDTETELSADLQDKNGSDEAIGEEDGEEEKEKKQEKDKLQPEKHENQNNGGGTPPPPLPTPLPPPPPLPSSEGKGGSIPDQENLQNPKKVTNENTPSGSKTDTEATQLPSEDATKGQHSHDTDTEDSTKNAATDSPEEPTTSSTSTSGSGDHVQSRADENDAQSSEGQHDNLESGNTHVVPTPSETAPQAAETINTTNANHTATPGDSDGSTAVSHTTSPLLLLLLVACAAAAAVVAA
ncbi:Mucin-associated surface protein (MASP), subgroup S074 [Trypanosoma cruzi]|nr:Mucin-associated surface protein (MASP), subgroup S074 [Trypanosoma cruzi]